MLTLHFFKLVAVVKVRVYLDFELDESYTPTKIVFLAGMGGNDLVEFATWQGEGPCGWIDIPLEGVGGRSGGWVTQRTTSREKGQGQKQRKKPLEHDDDFLGDLDDDDDTDLDEIIDDMNDPYAGSVLKAMVIQMRVVENHQNGKDTHVRGFQIFARDEDRHRIPSSVSTNPRWRHNVRKPLRTPGKAANVDGVAGLEEPDWMGEPIIR